MLSGMDGMRHAAVFMMRGEPQVIQAIDESAEVIMNNCVRCHATEYRICKHRTYRPQYGDGG